jgi:hypothetical protein
VITEAVMNAFSIALRAILDALFVLIPKPPTWLVSHVDDLQTLWGYVDAFDTWIPVNLAFTVATAVCVTWVLGMVIGIIRVVASYFTFGGGAT